MSDGSDGDELIGVAIVRRVSVVFPLADADEGGVDGDHEQDGTGSQAHGDDVAPVLEGDMRRIVVRRRRRLALQSVPKSQGNKEE